jgi:hypothetical protein
MDFPESNERCICSLDRKSDTSGQFPENDGIVCNITKIYLGVFLL